MSKVRARLFTTFTFGTAVAVLVSLAAAPASADADVREDIEEKTQQAMENFDLLEFDEAKKLLNEAIALAKRKKIRDKTLAAVHLNLGIVYFSGYSDKESAKLQFIEAVQIAGDIEIDKAYATAEMSQLLTDTREQYAGGDVTPPPTGDDDDGGDEVDCDALSGLRHDLIDETPAGRPAKVVVYVGADVGAKKVAVYYRPKGTAKFTEAALAAKGCRYTGDIPAAALRGDMLHYYVAAVDKGGKKVANKGSKGSPNIVEIAQVGTGAFTDENPLGANGDTSTADTGTGGDVSSVVGPIGEPKQAKLFLSLAAGTGGGYVTGDTERVQSPVGCCFAPALLHVMPELGYFINPQLAVSAAFRFGFPVGANVNGHATGAPAGLIRVRYALDPAGDGIQLTGAIGAGLLRHTVKIENQSPDMDTDTTASGPVLLGAGAAYVRPLSGPMKFIVELNALSAFTAGISELGDCPDGDSCVRPSFGLQVDANLGIMFAF
jgi:hypothetical protein